MVPAFAEMSFGKSASIFLGLMPIHSIMKAFWIHFAGSDNEVSVYYDTYGLVKNWYLQPGCQEEQNMGKHF